MKVGVWVTFIVVFSGCVELVDGGDTDTAAPTKTIDTTDCRSGAGYFVLGQHHPGFIGPEYQYMFYSLSRAGVLAYVRADTGWDAQSSTGSGKIVPKSGALHNITADEVKEELTRAGVYSTKKDFNVSVAYKDQVSVYRFSDLCEVVLKEFYRYDARYEQNISDCDGFTFKISTTKGVHESYSYCQAGPQGVRKSFDGMTAESRAKLGVPDL